MRHKKLIIAGIVALVLIPAGFGVGWLFISPRDDTVQVSGNLSAKDVAEIKATVWRFRRHEILPDFSWKSIRELPAGFKRYRQYRVWGIHGDDTGADASIMMVSHLKIVNQPNGIQIIQADSLMTCRAEKRPSGWRIVPPFGTLVGITITNQPHNAKLGSHF